MKIISACLCGINCKYNGGNNFHPRFFDMVKEGKAIPLCPEQLGGLPTPRAASEIVGGSGSDIIDKRPSVRVLNKEGQDITANLIRGAQEVLLIARQAGISSAILKSKSPSCGNGLIYDGTFNHKLVKGEGVTAACLKKNGIKVLSDEDVLKLSQESTGGRLISGKTLKEE